MKGGMSEQGYQTALYHASVGVATFKPSEVEENAMSE